MQQTCKAGRAELCPLRADWHMLRDGVPPYSFGLPDDEDSAGVAALFLAMS